MAFILASSGFENGTKVAAKFTGEGFDTSPELHWSGAPEGTKEFALICDDPDAPTDEPWVHWLVYGIPADAGRLPEDLAKDERPGEPAGMMQGKNSWGRIGYGGPMPPPGHGVHRYNFALYSVGEPLKLKPGATKKELLAAAESHVLGKAILVGLYERGTQKGARKEKADEARAALQGPLPVYQRP